MAQTQAAEQVQSGTSVTLSPAMVSRLQRAFFEWQGANAVVAEVTEALKVIAERLPAKAGERAQAYVREIDTALEYLGLTLPEGTNLGEVAVNFRTGELTLPKPKEAKEDQPAGQSAEGDAAEDTKGAE